METAGSFYINTFGCQMNVADTEQMTALLAEQGLKPSSSPEQADVILINGCSVREKAVHKAVSALGSYRVLKKTQTGQGPVIGVGGCVGQLEKKSLFKRFPYLDFVFGPDAIEHLPELVYQARQGERHVIHTQFDAKKNYSTRTKVFGKKAAAFVNIMKGCDKYCSYCIVPFTRGREKSRTIDEVLDDVAALAAKGVREVTLLGQNVNSFGKGNPNVGERQPLELHNPIGKVGPKAGEENFPQLLRAIDTDPRCQGLKRIRFTSSHPLDFSDELIDCYRPVEQGGVKRLARQLHLPVQSGSNAVLRKMARHHKIEHYVEQMKRLREIDPTVGISTDLIVGFPTETEEDFQETLKLLDEIRYDNIYAFAYSSRPGTKAAKMEDNVPAEVKKERLNRLLDHQAKISKQTYAERVGRTMEVLVEGKAKSQELFSRGKHNSSESPAADQVVWSGRTSCNRVVNFAYPNTRDLTGSFVGIKIDRATALSLYGELEFNPDYAEAGLTGEKNDLSAPQYLAQNT